MAKFTDYRQWTARPIVAARKAIFNSQKILIITAALPLIIQSAPAAAQPKKQWGADWSRCIRYDDNGFHNNCTKSMEVYWLDTGGGHNTVTIRGGATYPGGSKPQTIYACLSDHGNRLDWDARRCWYWE